MADKEIHKEYKAIPYFELKVIEDQGIVEHLISVFGVEDMGGDIVHPGAFTKTISERAGMIRVLDAHSARSALDVVGIPILLEEIGRASLPSTVLDKYPEATGGLKATTQFLMNTREGKGIFDRIKAGAISEFSFAYDTLDSDPTEREDGSKIRNLRTLRLWEYSPVVFGMNPATAVIDAKSDDAVAAVFNISVRSPETFKEGELTSMAVGDGITRFSGLLKEGDIEEVQSYSFDKGKWTVVLAREWVKDAGRRTLSLSKQVRKVERAFDKTYNPDWSWDYWVKEVFETHLIAEATQTDELFKVEYTLTEDLVEFTPKGEWIKGTYEFIETSISEEVVNGTKYWESLLLELDVERELIEITQLSIEAGPAAPPTS